MRDIAMSYVTPFFVAITYPHAFHVVPLPTQPANATGIQIFVNSIRICMIKLAQEVVVSAAETIRRERTVNDAKQVTIQIQLGRLCVILAPVIPLVQLTVSRPLAPLTGSADANRVWAENVAIDARIITMDSVLVDVSKQPLETPIFSYLLRSGLGYLRG